MKALVRVPPLLAVCVREEAAERTSVTVKSLIHSRRYPHCIAIFIVATTLVSLIYNVVNTRRQYRDLATVMGSTLLQEHLVTRKWNSLHGGVYVPVTDEFRPNPYLDDPLRDVTTTDGVRLTKVNPAYMTRLISELLEKEQGIQIHLAGENPINPENKADPMEVEALKKFERGLAEEIRVIGTGESSVFVHIAPMKMEESCTGCHRGERYGEGDVVGLINVSFSYAPFHRAIGQSVGKVIATHAVFLGVGFLLVLGIFGDIRRRRNTEENLRKLTTAVEHAGEVIMITDAGGTIEYVNRAFEHVTGYPRQEVIGENPRILKSGRHGHNFYRSMWETLARGEVWNGRFINHRKDGTPYHEETTISPIIDESGNIVNYVAVKHDISQEVALENQLRHAQKMEAVGQLAGGVAHDFNNILTAITGYASFLKMKMKDDDPLGRYVTQILDSSERAANLTRGLLTFSRKQLINPRPVDINTVLTRTGDFMVRLIGEDIEFLTEPSSGELPVMADPGQIEQVLVNLATNARDAMPDGGVLTIRAERVELDQDFIRTFGYGRPGTYALITAADTGTGMDEATREKIFEPFFTNKEVGRGTGLGLSIVYGIIKQHEGYINVLSEPGRGSTFNIYLPLIEGNVEEGGNTDQQIPLVGKETVLLAEDDGGVRGLMKDVLEKFGYRVIEAVDGEDAVEKFCGHADAVDLIILDVVMPKKNGKDVYDELKARCPGIRPLFISGYSEEIIRKKGLMDEGLHVLTKPVSPGDLLKKVRETLDSQDRAPE